MDWVRTVIALSLISEVFGVLIRVKNFQPELISLVLLVKSRKVSRQCFVISHGPRFLPYSSLVVMHNPFDVVQRQQSYLTMILHSYC
jgi:hypothetical protein